MPATALLTTLATDTLTALRCPAWCVETADHGLTDNEVAISGGIWREHHSAETVVAGMRVRIAQGVDYSIDHGLILLPATVQVCGCADADLVESDAHQLATVLAEHAASLQAVRA